jgi:ABC-type antimicrobial peptide transport system permease subunit
MSYFVTRRINEIGLRIALGAGRFRVLWLVLREVLILAAVGVAIGIPVSLAGDRFVSSMLFGLRGADALGLLSAVGLLVVVAVIAGYLPARRASLIDPMVALRYE